MRRPVVLWLWVAVCLAVPLRGEDPSEKVFSWIGATGRVLDGATPVEIPVTAAGEPVLRVRQVTRDGAAINVSDAFGVQYQNDAIIVTPSKGAEKPGTYVLHIFATAPAVKPQIVDVTLTRPAPAQKKKPEAPRAELEVDSSLYVDRIIDVPWFRVTVKPTEWLVRETGGKFAMTPSVPTSSAAITAKSSTDLGRLNVTFPTVHPRTSGNAALSIEGTDPWLGSANAKVRLESATLARTPIYTVVVRSRLAYTWLFLAIGAGVVLGYIVKRLLETRGAVLAARLAAREEAERVRAYELSIIDATVRKALLAQRALLEGANGTADEITKQMEGVRDEVKRIVDQAKADRQKAKDRLDTLQKALGRAEEQAMPLRSTVRGAATALEAQRTALDRGEIHEPARELARIESSLLAEVRDVLPEWTSTIDSAIAKFGAWPELAMSSAVTSVDTKVGTVDQRPATVEELKETLATTAEIASLLRHNIGNAGLPDVHETVKHVREALEKANAVDAATLESLKTAEKAVRDSRQADLPREIVKVAAAVQSAHEALTGAILAAYRKAKPTAIDKPEGLDAGQFRKALATVLHLPPPAHDAEKGMAGSLESPDLAVDEGPTALRSLDEGIPDPRTAQEIRKELRLIHGWRDAIYAVLVIIGGLIIFRGSFVGTIEDLAAALLWGFSVDLTAATLTTYASPLLARRPFRAPSGD